jgi:peptidoglycan/xylan/chitin deacetylase (PgdA/CDA1 family)
MRTIVADCVGRFLWPVTRRSLQGSVNVVYYHHVGDPDPHYAAFYRGCTTSKFAEDLSNLRRVFDFAPLSEVIEAGISRRASLRPLVAVTFDDGLDLRKHGAMDVLDEFGIKATMFVVTAVLGNRMLMWRYVLGAIQSTVPSSVWRAQYHQLAAAHGLKPLPAGQSLLEATYRDWEMQKKDQLASELWQLCGLPPVEQYLAEKRPYFDWEGIQEWIAAGHSVGFHTHTHPFCSRLGPAEIEAEVTAPALELRKRLGINDLYFSYPFGDRLTATLEHELVQKGLFSALFGTKGFVTKGTSHERLERLALEGLPVHKQLSSERFGALRRRVREHWPHVLKGLNLITENPRTIPLN